eukprot:2892138-Rhodomonas_salina.1
MERHVVQGRDAQGKLGLVVLAFSMAGKLQKLSAPCALCPGLFWTCTEDAVLTNATDPLKRYYIEAKTVREITLKTKWESMIGLLHPTGAKFRIFQTTGDTLGQIFDHMADSCYAVFIAHHDDHPKLLERARARDILCLDPKESVSSIPISATSGKDTAGRAKLAGTSVRPVSIALIQDTAGLSNLAGASVRALSIALAMHD